MHLCYIDESGTSDIPGNTSHFVLAGLSVPVWRWRKCDSDIQRLKSRYDLDDAEIHVAWMLRKYREQAQIPNFAALSRAQRTYEVERIRKAELLRLQKASNSKRYRQTRKNLRNTESYIHLTLDERAEFVSKVASCVSSWRFARLFAECVDKIHFDPARRTRTVDEQAFEQVISRFQQYLRATGTKADKDNLGLLIHDNNPTVARKHTKLMKQFHSTGTLWTTVQNIIETPLYVDSSLTSMVQIADLCAYALRRYVENAEDELFDLVFERADRKREVAVGVRHFTDPSCACKICAAHRS
jgi:hypothetical protein